MLCDEGNLKSLMQPCKYALVQTVDDGSATKQMVTCFALSGDVWVVEDVKVLKCSFYEPTKIRKSVVRKRKRAVPTSKTKKKNQSFA